MARGFDKINEFAKSISKNEGGGKKKEAKDFGPSVLFVSLQDGDNATVRFLEEGDEVYSYFYHDFSDVDEKYGWKYTIPCNDQDDEGKPCYGCEVEKPRKFQGLINVIWRDAPKYERDEDGVFVKDNKNRYVQEGTEDQVAVFRQGVNFFKTLGKKDVSWKGLGSREAIVERSGVKLDTEYSIEPADLDAGKTELSASDKKLAENKIDLETIPYWRSYEDQKGYIDFRQSQYDGEGNSSKEAVKDFVGKKGPFSS